MDIPNGQTKLTPAARQALDDAVEDFRNQILVGAEEAASQLSGVVREVSVYDVLRGLRAAALRPPAPPASWTQVALQFYLFAGIVLGLSGLVLLLVLSHYASLEWGPAGVGVALLAVGLAFQVITGLMFLFRGSVATYIIERSLDSRAVVAPLADYTQKWVELEIGLRTVATSRFGESAAHLPLSELLRNMVSAGDLSPAQHEQILHLLRLRNAIVHRRVPARDVDMAAALREMEQLQTTILPREPRCTGDT
jgi:hypothetical protein